MKTNVYDASKDWTEKDKARRQYENLQENQFRKVLEQDVVNNAKLNKLFIACSVCLALALFVTLFRIFTV